MQDPADQERPGPESDAADTERRLSTLAEISREMVRIYKVQFGRGPTKARTAFAGPDLIVCTLEDTLTPVERKMAMAGDHERLRDLRLYFQFMAEGEFTRGDRTSPGPAGAGRSSAAWTPVRTSPPSSSTWRASRSPADRVTTP